MAKITSKQISRAIEDLQAANGRRRQRIVSKGELLALIEDAERLYKDEARSKYFKGVKATELGTWDSKPSAYKWQADTTVIDIIIDKGKRAEVSVYRDDWGYVKVGTERLAVRWY